MGILDWLFGSINKGVAEWRNTPGALLLDVRTAAEYRSGHIPGSVHLPQQQLGRIEQLAPDKNTPLFTYCASGARAKNAAESLRLRGYKQVKAIGGISSYKGEVEK
ncbi:MAG: rhodanese-like domain-containing protein [Firmicutes bacterium]|nr:rhodanese-like domain-containing protein [Bacillota bacterium]